MINWEYLVVSLADQGDAAVVSELNEEGSHGWEAIGITTAEGGGRSVLMKRPLPQGRAPGGRI